MLEDIRKLSMIAAKPERMVIGLMSGTSMDGLDVALCRIRGHGADTGVELVAFDTRPYEASYRRNLAAVFSKAEVDLCTLTLLNPWVAEVHAAMVLSCLRDWKVEPEAVDLVASHGQTIYHAPKSLHRRPDMGNATLQIGDGDHIAVRTGIIAVHDFRQKHIAAGGEGAPLAAYGDLLIFSSPTEDRILLNLGGIANLTFLPRRGEAFSSDVGPGNTMMDALTQRHSGAPFDEGGRLAARGRVDAPLLASLLDHPFFDEGMPKTTGPELFNLAYLEAALEAKGGAGLLVEDQMATLAAFSAAAVAAAVSAADPEGEAAVYASGGGAHNPVLRAMIEQKIGRKIDDTASLGIDPDAKEAVLMALLANECVSGEALSSGRVAGMPGATLGKISFPG
jgi:anhydro-N-acetylmuramic acid kinase